MKKVGESVIFSIRIGVLVLMSGVAQVGKFFGRMIEFFKASPDPPPTPETQAGSVAARTATAEDQRSVHQTVGICLSGGGIRAAAVGLGALRRFDEPIVGQQSAFRSANWLSSVSGGGFAAGGWRVSRQPNANHVPDQTDCVDGLFGTETTWSEHVRTHHRYLDNGWGSLLGGIIGALMRTALVLSAVFGAAVIAGWLAGLFVRSEYVLKDFKQSATLTDLLPTRLLWPGLLLLVVGVVLLAVSTSIRSRKTLTRISLGIVASGLLLLALLVGLPVLLRYDRNVVEWLGDRVGSRGGLEEGPEGGTTFLAILNGLGLGGALVAVLRAEFKRRWLRLGGVLLGVLMFLVADVVAHATVTNSPAFGSKMGVLLLVLISAAAWAVLSVADTHRVSLAGIYRKRIATTFVTKRIATTSGGTVTVPIKYGEECAWKEFAEEPGPELIICATAHSSKLTLGGVKGYGLTFDAQNFTLFDGAGSGSGSSIAAAEYPPGSWWRGYPRKWSISRSMAISGAALASTMGRQALGTTNALLAATNLRLGMWLPNPKFAKEYFKDPRDQPRVGLVYLAKEIFGRYNPELDAFVYVADGGHRDNLGLVEMLRRKPRTIYVIDASGDKRGTFATLRAAIQLAFDELHVKIDMTWERITLPLNVEDPSRPALPASCATTAKVTYDSGGKPARLFYGRYQISQSAPRELLTYAAKYPGFPTYTTGDQFLKDDEYAMLVALGEHVAAELLALPDEGIAQTSNNCGD